jgi:hypothetical protein
MLGVDPPVGGHALGDVHCAALEEPCAAESLRLVGAAPGEQRQKLTGLTEPRLVDLAMLTLDGADEQGALALSALAIGQSGLEVHRPDPFSP